MNNAKKMFFVAVMPPELLQEEVRNIKLIIRDRYGSGHALNSPAHLTLIPPFFWPVQQEKDLINSLDNFCLTESSFQVRLNDFGAFRPRVIYIDVTENKKLTQLHERLNHFMEEKWKISELLRGNKPFNPHMTIAFRDLTRENFNLAWAEFKNKNFYGEFFVDKIDLLIHHQKHWKVYHQAPFGKN